MKSSSPARQLRTVVSAVAVAAAVLAACGNSTADPYANSIPDPVAATTVVSSQGTPTTPTSDPSGDGRVSIASTSSVVSIPPETPRRVLQIAYGQGMKNGWKDVGWDPNRIVLNGPARIDLGNGGGWLIAGTPPEGATGLEFRFRTPAEIGPVVRVVLGTEDVENIGREVRLISVRRDSEGWSSVRIPLYQLNPKGVPFTQVRFAPRRRLRSPALIEIDDLLFTEGGSMVRYGSSAGVRPAAPTTLPRVTINASEVPDAGPDAPRVQGLKPGLRFPTKENLIVDCKTGTKPISQLIYGIGWAGAFNQKEDPWELFPGANRWGGNPTSRFNWENGNAWNTANDYFFRNTEVSTRSSNAMEAFLAGNEKNGVPSAVSVPTLGWVAKDTESYGFPVFDFGAQEKTDPEILDAGNGVDSEGRLIVPGSPKRTSVVSTPESIAAWVGEQLAGRVTMYFLDNEPDLWNSTHRDVRPQPLGYDELLQNTIDYAAAIRSVEPDAIIAGPSSWGWTGYFFSAVDAAAGFDKAPDRKAHAGLPLLAWYLKAMRTYEKRNNVKLLDALDVHFYPAASGLYGPGSGADDSPETAAKRIRSTKGLWDPNYVDESWIGEPVRLIPRLREWIDQNAPGLGISIGEWSFGGEGHMSGGLAVAEALGRFGKEGVTAAYYWTAPPKNSEAFWGFRAYRNYDGKGSNFQNTGILNVGFEDTRSLSAFSSRNEAGTEITLVLLNTSPTEDETTKVQLLNCSRLESYQNFVYTGGPEGFVAEPELAALNDSLSLRLPKYSITVLRARLR
jgi:hypothetical protein